MANITNSNLGMYAEDLVNRTAEYWYNKNIGLLEKREIPIKIFKKIDATTILGKLMSKSFVDYFGFYKSNYFEFDVKETSKEYFDKALLQKHQIQRLEKLNEMNIKGFVLVYFSLKEEFYVIDYKVFINHTKNKMDYEFIRTNCHELKIIYPGILDLISYL